jgi:hypothetical protein
MDRRGNRAAQRGMAAVLVVAGCELVQQLLRMVQSANHRHPLQPFVLQREDDPFGHRDGAVLADGTKPLVDIPPDQQVTEGIAEEDTFLVGDEAPRSTVLSEGPSHRAHHPARVGSFQGTDGDDLAREVIDRHQHPRGPNAPPPHSDTLHAPDVARITGDVMATGMAGKRPSPATSRGMPRPRRIRGAYPTSPTSPEGAPETAAGALPGTCDRPPP